MWFVLKLRKFRSAFEMMSEHRDQLATKDGVIRKVNRPLDKAFIRSDRKRRSGNKSDSKLDIKLDSKLDNRSDHRSDSSTCSCSSIKCSSSVNNRPVNFHSSLQCNLSVDDSSVDSPGISFGDPSDDSSCKRNSSSNLSQSSSNRNPPSDCLTCVDSTPVEHPPIHRKFLNCYSSSLQSPPVKRRKTGQFPLRSSAEFNSSPAEERFDRERPRNEKNSSCEANCSRSTVLSSTQPVALPGDDKENNFNNFRDHENDFRHYDKPADYQSNDKVSTTVFSHKIVRAKTNCDSSDTTDSDNLKDSSNVLSHSSNHPLDDSLQPVDSNCIEHIREQPAKQLIVVAPLFESFETNYGGNLVDRQRDEDATHDRTDRIRRFLTCSGPVKDVEYWRLKCERLSTELKLALDELDGLANENELLELELNEFNQLSKACSKLKRLLQMLGL